MFSKQALSCNIEQRKGVWEDLHSSFDASLYWGIIVFICPINLVPKAFPSVRDPGISWSRGNS